MSGICCRFQIEADEGFIRSTFEGRTIKLASIALLLGGTALGAQLGGVDVHDELHTERLFLHSKDRDRIVSITSTDEAGLLIALGDAQSLTTAQVRIEPEMHSWILNFEHESGSRFTVEVDPEGAKQTLFAGVGSASAGMHAWFVHGGGGSAGARFHPGGEAVPGEACSIGAEEGIGEAGPHSILRLRRQMFGGKDDEGEPMFSWQNVVQIGGDEASLVSPWVTKPR